MGIIQNPSLNFIKIAFIQRACLSTDEQMIAVDLNEILAIAVSSLDEKIKVHNAVIRPGALPSVRGYPSLISLLFHHPISNSIKFRKKELDLGH